MKNKCTLLVDGNWLLQSRAAIMMNNFKIDNPDIAKEQSSKELTELMARSINVILNRFQDIDNIIMISDGGSWRKQLPIPDSLVDVTYKGNRSQVNDIDWNYIYDSLNRLTKKCKEVGITTVSHSMIEGDDWVWYWSRRLNEEGTHCIIWSSDNDLKQLIQLKNQSVTAWYNDTKGLWLPEELNLVMSNEEDIMDFFMKPHLYSTTIENIKKQSKSINYVKPETIALSKIICGDSGDNIKSVFRYIKNGRTYRISDKEWGNLSKTYNINTVNELHDRMDQIVEAICVNSKYKEYNPDKDSISEMIQYNTKLVYLNESVIPETIIMYMNQQEYKLFDIPYIRSNFRILLDDNDNMIKNLFEEI